MITFVEELPNLIRGCLHITSADRGGAQWANLGIQAVKLNQYQYLLYFYLVFVTIMTGHHRGAIKRKQARKPRSYASPKLRLN